MLNEPIVGDAFGMLLAHHQEIPNAVEIVERDDGFIDATGAGHYFDQAEAWPLLDVAAVRRCKGRVLDVGAGAGRASLELQHRLHGVVALDTSPGAIGVCRNRGVQHTFTGTVYGLADSRPDRFDTILLLGNNLGLLGTPEAAPGFLAALATLSAPDATVIGIGVDPHGTDDPFHLAYHEGNRAAGRPSGQLRLRVRHRALATPWFSYLLLSPDELECVTRGTDWRLGDVQTDASLYLAVLTKR
jgi:SAM-dependent methyltransferase